jgi:hypothetical protein
LVRARLSLILLLNRAVLGGVVGSNLAVPAQAKGGEAFLLPLLERAALVVETIARARIRWPAAGRTSAGRGASTGGRASGRGATTVGAASALGAASHSGSVGSRRARLDRGIRDGGRGSGPGGQDGLDVSIWSAALDGGELGTLVALDRELLLILRTPRKTFAGVIRRVVKISSHSETAFLDKSKLNKSVEGSPILSLPIHTT